jgi:hypothetical protein
MLLEKEDGDIYFHSQNQLLINEQSIVEQLT